MGHLTYSYMHHTLEQSSGGALFGKRGRKESIVVVVV